MLLTDSNTEQPLLSLKDTTPFCQASEVSLANNIGKNVVLTDVFVSIKAILDR